MRPVPISDVAAKNYPGFVRKVIAGPSGNLLSDGTSVNEALPVDVLFGLDENRYPCFIERWVLENGELEILKDWQGEIEVKFWTPQLFVHSFAVVPGK